MSIDLNSCIGLWCMCCCLYSREQTFLLSVKMRWTEVVKCIGSVSTVITAAMQIERRRSGDIKKMEDPEWYATRSIPAVMCQHCACSPRNCLSCNRDQPQFWRLNQMTLQPLWQEHVIVRTTVRYKVRRFNWFQYSDNAQFDFNMNDDLGQMVSNRMWWFVSPGVMENVLCVFSVYGKEADCEKKDANWSMAKSTQLVLSHPPYDHLCGLQQPWQRTE